MLARRRAFAVTVSLLGAACVGPTGIDLEWLAARTLHFRIWSSLSRADTVALARDLESFRALVIRATGVPEIENRAPTSIYFFRSRASFAPFTASPRVLGFFADDMRGSRMAVQANAGIEELAVLKHEYVHFLLASSKVSYPVWYHEGFAEFLATAQVRPDRIELGHPPLWRFQAFSQVRWVPLSRILSAPEGAWTAAEWAMLYTESWALVHYLHFGRSEERNVAEDLARYLRETARGTDPERAAQLAFGTPVRTLDRLLSAYVQKGRFPYVSGGLEDLTSDAAPEIELASPEQLSLDLGRLALAVDRPEQAREYFEAARARAPGSSRALAELAVAQHRAGNREEARLAFEQALRQDPDDPITHLDFARHLHDLAVASENAGSAAGAAFLKRARSHYVKSWKLDDTIPETYAMYGSTFLVEGEDASKGVPTLERAYVLLRGNQQIELLLARAYRAVGRRQESRDLAIRILGWSHDLATREAAEALLAALDSEETAPSDPRPLRQPR